MTLVTLTKNVSLGSNEASPLTSTLNVYVVAPAAMVCAVSDLAV